jgi:cathepsin C
MKEVMQNGPVVVSFEPDYMFMHYRRGIYKSIGETWLTRGEAKPQWVKVDHSVALVGWGYDEAKQVPYWILQNSWGKHWGEGGYFRMIRGIDHMGIESICEAGEPYIKSLNNNK